MAKLIAASGLGVPPETYLYTLARIDELLATIGSDDSLRLFDPSLKLVQSAQVRDAGFECLKPYEASAFATAGRDGVIRLWDARAKQVAKLTEPSGGPISALACHDHIIAAGTESAKEGLGDVSVLLYDTRRPSIPLRSYVESHTDTITQLAFHPNQPNVLLSGSTDGLVSIFDANQVEEEDAIQQVLNPRSAIHCAGFLRPDQAYVFTTDEQFLVYPLEEPVEGTEPSPPLDCGDVRPRLNAMYVIDLLWLPTDGEWVIAHGHNVNGTLALTRMLSHGPLPFGDTVQLPGAHGEEVVRDVLLAEDMAYSCGEDGQVKVWKW